MRATIRTLSIFLMLSLILTGPSLVSGSSNGEAFLPASTARLGRNLASFEPSEAIPLLRFSDAREVMAEFQKGDGVKALSTELGHSLSVTLGQIDGDGVLDLVVGFENESKGAIAVYRGNPDFLFSPRVKNDLVRETGLEIPAFLDPATVIKLPIRPDFVAIGDFNADGRPDVVAAQRGGTNLVFLRGEEQDHLSGETSSVSLPGPLTALASGEVNRFDHLEDLIVGVTAPDGPKVMVFEAPDGALGGEPEVFRTQSPMTEIVIGQLDGDISRDIAAAGSREMIVINGRDRKLALSESVRAEVAAATVKRFELGTEIESLAVGNFSGDHRDEVAVLGTDGGLEVVDLWEAEGSVKSVSIGSPSEGAALQTARVSGLRYDDLLVLDGEAGTLEVLSYNALPDAKSTARDWHCLGKIKVTEPLGAMFAGRIDYDALDDLVFFGGGASGPGVMVREPLDTYMVNSTDNVLDGVCDASHCSFRDAFWETAQNPGVDTIRFDVGFAAIQLTGNGIGVFSEAVIIDGTQGSPPFTHFTEIDGSGLTGGGPMLWFLGPSTTLTTVIVGGHPSDDCVSFAGADNSLMTRSRIGVGANGVANIGCSGDGVSVDRASGVEIGGTSVSSRNVIGGNGENGISINGLFDEPWAASGNWVMGNYIGTDSSGLTSLGNQESGVSVRSAVDNHIGGDQRGNVISGNTSNGVYIFNSEGTTLGANLIGLDVTGSSGIPNSKGVWIYGSTITTVGGTLSTVRNTISGNTNQGIRVSELNASMTEIFGNYIGTDISGALAIANGGAGVETAIDPNGVSVGGASAGSGNLISGNLSAGVNVYSGQTVTVQGNLIGSDATGTYAIPNGSGVNVSGDGILVGGADPLEGNLISGNAGNGISVSGAGSITVRGNRVGTDGTGSGALGNGGNGISFNITTDPFSVVGGTGHAANTVAFNGGAGLALVNSSWVEILPNSIHSNAGLGIDLGADGVTINDTDDADGGPNHFQNFPIITSVTPGAADVTIAGTLNSEANHDFEIYFFRSSGCDSSVHGEGEVYLGYFAVSTDAGGDAVFNVTLPETVPDGAFITATATRVEGSWGATSEFSACFQVIDVDSLIFADGFESGNTTGWSSSFGQ